MENKKLLHTMIIISCIICINNSFSTEKILNKVHEMPADLGLIIAIVGSAIAIIGVVTGMFFWLRGESNDDRRYFSQIQADDRKEILQIIRSIEFEMKDFHARLEKQDAEFKAHLMYAHKNPGG